MKNKFIKIKETRINLDEIRSYEFIPGYSLERDIRDLLISSPELPISDADRIRKVPAYLHIYFKRDSRVIIPLNDNEEDNVTRLDEAFYLMP